MSAPTELVDHACFMAEEMGFPVFPVKVEPNPKDPQKMRKRPLIKKWQNGGAACDRGAIEALFAAHPNATHIGLQTGKRSCSLVIDLDGKQGMAWWGEMSALLPATRTQRTQREDSAHLYYRIPADCTLRNSAGKIAPGVDIRADGGFVVDWSVLHPPAVEDITDAPSELIEFLQRAVKRAAAKSKAAKNGSADKSDITEGGRNNALTSLAGKMRRADASETELSTALKAFNAERCKPPLDDAEVCGIATSVARYEPVHDSRTAAAPPTAEVISEIDMLRRFIHVAAGPVVVDLENTNRRLRPHEFAAHYAASRIAVGKALVPATTLWTQSPDRISVHRLTFDPAQPKFFNERGLRYMNLYDPPRWPDVDARLAAPFIEHLEYMVPDRTERSDFLDWLAHAVQHPGVRPHHHFLMLAHNEGTGRSWVGEILRGVMGDRHVGQVDLHRLLDDTFNSELSCKVMMVVSEVRAPADERYSHRDRLKSLLTDMVLTVNEKHLPRWTEKLVARFLMFTNRADALPLSETDRRVYVVRCAETFRGEDYYSGLYARVGDPALLAAVHKWLKARNIAKFNPGRRSPLTESKEEMISTGRTDEQETAIEFAQCCPFPIVPATDLMRALAPEHDHERAAERKARMNAIAAALRDAGMATHARKVRIGDRITRVWVMRNPGQWRGATAAYLKEVAAPASAALAELRWTADRCIEAWQT